MSVTKPLTYKSDKTPIPPKNTSTKSKKTDKEPLKKEEIENLPKTTSRSRNGLVPAGVSIRERTHLYERGKRIK